MVPWRSRSLLANSNRFRRDRAGDRRLLGAGGTGALADLVGSGEAFALSVVDLGRTGQQPHTKHRRDHLGGEHQHQHRQAGQVDSRFGWALGGIRNPYADALVAEESDRLEHQYRHVQDRQQADDGSPARGPVR